MCAAGPTPCVLQDLQPVCCSAYTMYGRAYALCATGPTPCVMQGYTLCAAGPISIVVLSTLGLLYVLHTIGFKTGKNWSAAGFKPFTLQVIRS